MTIVSDLSELEIQKEDGWSLMGTYESNMDKNYFLFQLTSLQNC